MHRLYICSLSHTQYAILLRTITCIATTNNSASSRRSVSINSCSCHISPGHLYIYLPKLLFSLAFSRSTGASLAKLSHIILLEVSLPPKHCNPSANSFSHLQVLLRLTVSLPLVESVSKNHEQLESNDREDHLRGAWAMRLDGCHKMSVSRFTPCISFQSLPASNFPSIPVWKL